MNLNLTAPSYLHSSKDIADDPAPPSLHWGLVLLFYMLTFGIFGVVWVFRQAAWVRRIDPTSNALFLLIVAFALPLLAMFGGNDAPMPLVRVLANFGSMLIYAWAYFSMRDAIEDRYELSLSGLMTFFFHVFYLQYHMTRIAKGEGIARRDFIDPRLVDAH